MGLFFLSVVPIVSAQGWSYRKAITIDHTKVDATLTDFPVLISITDTDLRDHAQGDGDDIFFVNVDNTIKLDHEIEYFNGPTGELQAWVRIPSLYSSTDTTIYMYYGNPTCGNQQNATGVWDSNYAMVQHLEESCASSGCRVDSTSNLNTGTPYSGATITDLHTSAGKIEGADDFDGTNDYIDCGNDESLNAQYQTIEFWVKYDCANSGFIMTKEVISADRGWSFIHYGTDHGNMIYFNTGNSPLISIAEGDACGKWHHIAASVGPTGVYCYLDGILDGSDTSHTTGVSQNNNIVQIGCGSRDNNNNHEQYLDGTIDEVRISNTAARSGDWIKTEYNNQHSPSMFYSVGDEEYPVPEQPVPELPTIILFSIGWLVLAGYVVVKKKKRQR